jgi:transcriptional regulator with XRE-family HTH domain
VPAWTIRSVDPVRFGLAIRALRRRKHMTQQDVADKANVSQSAVSRAERGEVGSLTIRVVERIAHALDATASVRLYWQGEELDRLLDAAHAGLVEQVVEILRSRGWEVVPEVTFSVYGERGSIDVLAFQPDHGALLIIEVKSVVPDMQAMLSGIDRKFRLAPGLVRDRGWAVRSVSRLLVLPEDRTARRRIDRYGATIDQVLPLRTRGVRRWLASPTAAMAGVLFLPSSPSTTARHRVGRRKAAPAAMQSRAHEVVTAETQPVASLSTNSPR